MRFTRSAHRKYRGVCPRCNHRNTHLYWAPITCSTCGLIFDERPVPVDPEEEP